MTRSCRSGSNRVKNKTNPFLTPRDLARVLKVSTGKILGWIRRGELRAVNVSDSDRVQYRISPEALDAFLADREVAVQVPEGHRRRRVPEGGPIDPKLGEELLKKGQAAKIGKEYYRVWNGTILRY